MTGRNAWSRRQWKGRSLTGHAIQVAYIVIGGAAGSFWAHINPTRTKCAIHVDVGQTAPSSKRGFF